MQKNILWVLQSFYALIYVLDFSPERGINDSLYSERWKLLFWIWINVAAWKTAKISEPHSFAINIVITAPLDFIAQWD